MKTRTLPGSEAASTPFLKTSAVETWDTWFRWRADGQLRDVTVDDTWRRVASALAAGPVKPSGYERRLTEAFAAWHLLLDERVIATAGTDAPQWSADNLHAVLNAASFVRAPGLQHAAFDYSRFEEVAALALHALEDAAALVAGDGWPNTQIHVGIVGLGDALALLDADYAGESGRMQAVLIVQALARGCLAGAIALARDRGARFRCDHDWKLRMRNLGYPQGLIDEALRHGLRQRELTAITSQPRLAAFANGVTDALDPLPDACCDQADGYAASVRRRTRGVATAGLAASVPNCVAGQLRMRAAVQPWIDKRINYPLNLERAPGVGEISDWTTLARELGLGPLSWRSRPRGAQGTDAPISEFSSSGAG